MRTTWVLMSAIALVGCGQMDSKPTSSVETQTAPGATRTNDTARPGTSPTDNATTTTTVLKPTMPMPTPMPAPAARPDDPQVTTDRTAITDRTVSGESTVRPDNTAVNARDADRQTRDPKLPIDQKENQADINVTAKIRQRVVAADGLSINAQNVKIITADGKVTLRGPVESDAERDTIARIARDVAGEGNVEDQIDVKANAAATAPATTTLPSTTTTTPIP